MHITISLFLLRRICFLDVTVFTHLGLRLSKLQKINASRLHLDFPEEKLSLKSWHDTGRRHNLSSNCYKFNEA